MRKFIITISLMFLLSKPAYAYLDFGSITFALQSLMALLAGLLVSVHLYFNKIKQFFKKIFKKKTNR